MIDKLLKSNPKNYTLPLIREGVTQFIKTISTLEDLEKVTGLTFNEQQSSSSPDGTSGLNKTEEMLLHAKHIIQKGPGSDDSSE